MISVYTAPGYSNEVLHIFIARKLRYVGSRPEFGEVIEVYKMPFNKALELAVFKCRVCDAKTVIGLMLVRHILKLPKP